MGVKLNLGHGGNYMNGYVNIDKYTKCRTDVREDVLTMDYNRYKPVSEIRSAHMFEHFRYYDSLALLTKWIMCLERNGLLLIDIPDPIRIAAACNGSPAKQRACMRLLFGSQEDPTWSYHINGWTESLLRDTLGRMGMKCTDARNYGSPEGNFPHMGTEYAFVKTNSYNIAHIKSQCMIMLLDYCHPNEQDLFKYYQKMYKEIV